MIVLVFSQYASESKIIILEGSIRVSRVAVKVRDNKLGKKCCAGSRMAPASWKRNPSVGLTA